jgi:hypothetical protein
MRRYASPQAVCDRCRVTMEYSALSFDRDNPGLRVCVKCNDQLDPYKLPARKTENITLRYPRPEYDPPYEKPDVITTESDRPIDFPPELTP